MLTSILTRIWRLLTIPFRPSKITQAPTCVTIRMMERYDVRTRTALTLRMGLRTRKENTRGRPAEQS